MSQMKDVAKLAGVGIGSVSRVINNNGYVSDELREKIERAIGELNYVPNQFGRNLKTQCSNMVALFVPTIMHSFFSKIAYYIEDALYKEGFKTIIVSSQGNKDKEINLLNMIKTNQVDGIIFITNHTYPDMSLEGLNLVTVDRHIQGVPCVTSDNYDSTRKAILHLVAKGCKKIGYIGGTSKVESETKKRYLAYLEVMKENNLEVITCYKEVLHGEEFQVAKEFLHSHPQIDGIFAQSDTFANVCYQIVIQNGRRVPQDVKIIAFDGVIDEILQHPKFSVVKQDVKQMAYEAVNQLLHKINHETCQQYTYIKTNFILGETTEE